MFQFNTIEEALEDLRQGKIIRVTDDEDRENEGDMICAAEFATTENVNLMAKEAKGSICMPMSAEYCMKLQFPQMVSENTDNHETAFTVSIDHVNTTTGISAEERGLTARACVDENSKPQDFRRPGHMFPLKAKKRRNPERNGHTEATVDLLRLAGLKECGLCCEVMREDGTMMRTPELIELAKKYDMKFITIKGLQDYRKRHEKLVDCEAAVNLPTKYGSFKAYGYGNRLNGEHHIALVKGDIGDGKNLLCRVHSECMTGDTFGSLRCDCGDQLAAAMTQIETEGRGILLYMRQEGRGIGSASINSRLMSCRKKALTPWTPILPWALPETCANTTSVHRSSESLGAKELRLLTNNPDKIYQLSDFGMEITERVPIQIKANKNDLVYLRTKKSRMGHLLEDM